MIDDLKIARAPSAYLALDSYLCVCTICLHVLVAADLRKNTGQFRPGKRERRLKTLLSKKNRRREIATKERNPFYFERD